MPDPESRILLPVQGVSDTMAFTDTPPVVAPPDSLLNVVPFDVVKNRGRLGTRWGLEDFGGQQFSGGSAIQGMGAFSRAEVVTGYREVNCESYLSRLGPDTKVQALRGQVWMLNKEFAMRRQWHENLTAGGASDYGPDSASASPSVTCITLSPDKTRVYIGETYFDGTSTVARITCLNRVAWLDMDDNRDSAQINTVVLWTRKISDTSAVFVNQITATANYVFVASNHLVRILNAADGTNAAQASFGCNGWSNEVLATAVSTDGLFLYILFLGAGYNNTLNATVGNTSGAGVTVAVGAPAIHFRSGIMKCRLGTGSTVLTQVSWSTQLAAADDYFEGGENPPMSGTFVAHGYLRFFEALNRNAVALGLEEPDRGMYPTGFAVCPDGGIVVAHANAAWGPKTTQKPDRIGASVTKFDVAGDIVWQASLPTFTEDRDGDGYYNDLPGLSSETCSAHAIAVDSDGDVFVGGRVNTASAGGTNFHKIAGDGSLAGVVLWSIRLGDASTADSIFENGITVDPADNQPVICGARATAWTGVVSAAPAHIWKRRSLDGGVLQHFDLNASGITALSAVCDGGGNTYYCSDLVI